MLLEVLDSPILIDGKPIATSVRVKTFHPQRQLRAKVTVPYGDSSELIDLVVRQYSNISPSTKGGVSLAFAAEGEEMVSGNRFIVHINYEILKDQWSLTGNFGPTRLDFQSKKLEELVSAVSTTLLAVRKQK